MLRRQMRTWKQRDDHERLLQCHIEYAKLKLPMFMLFLNYTANSLLYVLYIYCQYKMRYLYNNYTYN